MGPYYDHCSLQMWAVAGARRDVPNRAAVRSQDGAKWFRGKASRSPAVGALAVVALAFSLAGLLSNMVAGDGWAVPHWCGLFSASIAILTAAVSLLWLVVAG